MPRFVAVVSLLILVLQVQVAWSNDHPSAHREGSGSQELAPLPHREQVAPGVHAAGFSARYHSANCGWIELDRETLLVDLPRGMPVLEFLNLVATSTGKPARRLVLTHAEPGDSPIVHTLIEHGVMRVLASPKTHAELIAGDSSGRPLDVSTFSRRTAIGEVSGSVDFLPFDGVAGRGAAAVFLPGRSVLFAGPLVVHGPRTVLKGSNTERWVQALHALQTLAPAHVIPGFGSWGGVERISRQSRFLSELRRQVAHQIAQGRPAANLRQQVRLPSDVLVWMPYDDPTAEDLQHVYRELTVPIAPFHGDLPSQTVPVPHALVLIGDQPHEPGHLEEGLRPAFEATGVIPHFTVDVRALSAENLARVKLLVILRDGLQRPDRDAARNFMWMTRDQERAVAAFVHDGGGFLNLHNSLGLYPPDGPYLDMVVGRYTTHGPLERFRVDVVDPDHPVTRGVSTFFVADEQHTPAVAEARVHMLLRSLSDEGKSGAAGWVRESGFGRVCHLANGHTREALLHPMYQKLLANAVRWCLRLETQSPSAPSSR